MGVVCPPVQFPEGAAVQLCLGFTPSHAPCRQKKRCVSQSGAPPTPSGPPTPLPPHHALPPDHTKVPLSVTSHRAEVQGPLCTVAEGAPRNALPGPRSPDRWTAPGSHPRRLAKLSPPSARPAAGHQPGSCATETGGGPRRCESEQFLGKDRETQPGETKRQLTTEAGQAIWAGVCLFMRPAEAWAAGPGCAGSPI